MLRFRSLGSGSAGNATVVEASNGLRTTRLLIDCGLGLRQLDQRLARAGLAACDIDAIFVTHEHGDHIGCAHAFALRGRVPVWMSSGTFSAIGSPDFDGLWHQAADGAGIDLGEMCVTPFTVPHDAREPLQLCCTDGAVRFGVLTDLGHATTHVLEQLSRCDALLLECNHAPELLAASSYPPFLKRRVGGNYGHLSNASAAAIARAVCHPGLKAVVAAHLSLQNNRPHLAAEALAQALGWDADRVGIADAVYGTDWIGV